MRTEAKYFGNVQGVSFRYTASSIARMYGLSGFVRNEIDGSVYLLVDGADDEVKAFLRELNERMAGYIERAEYNTLQSGGNLGSFEIRWD